MTVAVAHDYTCPWCYIGWNQSLRIRSEFGHKLDWLSYELWPDELDPPASRGQPVDPARPRVPSRIELAYIASGVQKPRFYPRSDRIHNALEATEHAKTLGLGQDMVDRLYRALWQEGLDINDPAVLCRLADGVIPDPDRMLEDVASQAHRYKIVRFDEGAYGTGVYHVPTFFIGGKRYAEQPWPVLERALRSLPQ